MGITRRQVVAGLAGLGLLAAGPAGAGETMRLSGRAFGTTWSVMLPGGMAGDEPTGIAAVLERIDRSMSPFRADSELSIFNRAAAGRHAAGADFATVTAAALRIAAWSGGAFDPSVGPLVSRYGFGPIGGERGGDFHQLSCDGRSIGKEISGLSLDLCGIAKGYALDAVGQWLAGQGHRDFLIDIGGELLAAGSGPDGGPWRLGIEDPLHGGVLTRITASGLALATSGDRINSYEVAGRRYSHIIDPATGEPVRNRLASVTVVGGSAMEADGLATAMMVLGPERGLALAEADAVPVLFLIRDGTGLAARRSSAFAALERGA